MIGSRDPFVPGNFNRVSQAQRAAGSTFKVPVYYLLMREGLSADLNVSTARICLPPFYKGLPAWCPKNAHPPRFGKVSAKYALAHSINTATARIVYLLNSRHGNSWVTLQMINLMAQVGIPREDMAVQPSLPLGPSSVTPIGLVQLYAAITHGGVYVKTYVVDTCRDVRRNQSCDLGEIMRREERVVADPQAAGLLTDMLKAVSKPGGTGALVGAALPNHELAIKTGTSQNNGTAWLVGCTEEICGATYVGFDRESLGLGVDPATGKEWQGGRTAGPPWSLTAKHILKDRAPQRFTAPEGVVEIVLVKERTTSVDGTPAIGIRCARDQEDVRGKNAYTEWYRANKKPSCTGYIARWPIAQPPTPPPITRTS
jgi:membrane peptidoglycan carboxypeptidase